MIQIHIWLHFKFKELSNDILDAQIRVKTKKLWLGKENKTLSIVCRNTPLAMLRHTLGNVAIPSGNVATHPKCVTTLLRVCHDMFIEKQIELLIV